MLSKLSSALGFSSKDSSEYELEEDVRHQFWPSEHKPLISSRICYYPEMNPPRDLEDTPSFDNFIVGLERNGAYFWQNDDQHFKYPFRIFVYDTSDLERKMSVFDRSEIHGGSHFRPGNLMWLEFDINGGQLFSFETEVCGKLCPKDGPFAGKFLQMLRPDPQSWTVRSKRKSERVSSSLPVRLTFGSEYLDGTVQDVSDSAFTFVHSNNSTVPDIAIAIFILPNMSIPFQFQVRKMRTGNSGTVYLFEQSILPNGQKGTLSNFEIAMIKSISLNI